MNLLSKNWGKLVTAALVVLAGMRLLDLLMLWGLFSKFASTFRGVGVTNDYLVNAMSVAMMTIAALLLRHLIWKFILRRTEQGTLIFGAAITGWMLLMYVVSLPGAGEYFNPVTGQPRYVYIVLSNGEIDLQPLGYKYHPVTGEEMQSLTREAVKQYADKIQRFAELHPSDIGASSFPRAEPPPPPGSAGFQYTVEPQLSKSYIEVFSWQHLMYETLEGCATMRIVGMRLGTNALVLRVEYRNGCTGKLICLSEPESEDTYMVSDEGEGLKLRSNDGDFSFWGSNGCSNHYSRGLLPGEAFSYSLVFAPLTHFARQLTFTNQKFEKAVITFLAPT
ncbi:MAG: hypothetical protein COT91_00590 [Candidatus Doudnabacteria bacterium CG10_big_fil_rev_8_21_14_0_10_41_10]|uniref:Uncharacterized protein n=1 Tax=Candidatus Doudnabacteria bacterium CG10_big_fil_rev_8_21_14_0_10_41_10 TaxID=1974551 RepID=A0A2H0VEV9_9BACT|nr:MAG: hypothetical protein COT91_00590 [Candidatus Doudnabacteria bacterium CG10_big_fil_rev_8_21_14_0_10_41_10]